MKTAFITGANRGLGYGFVQYLLQEGYEVFAGTRDIDTTLQHNKYLHWIKLDVKDDTSITEAVQAISKFTDHLDLLVNNAGINKDTGDIKGVPLTTKLNHLHRSALIDMFNVNTIGPMMVLKHCLPLLTASASAFVINITSCRASYHDEFENISGNYGYRASKTALNMMTFCSLFDLPSSVKTFAVHPGNVKSDMNPHGDNEPIDRAEKIMRIVKNWNEGFNGKFLRHDGTLYPL